MSKKLTIAVIFGGRSGEHEVSLVSATAIIKNLARLRQGFGEAIKKKYNVIPIGVAKTGEWLTGPNVLDKFKNGLKNKQGLNKIVFDPPGKLSVESVENKSVVIDVAFPILHGTYGEDGTIQGLFEIMNVPYVGAGVLGSAVGMDKVIQKKLLRYEKLPVIKFIELLITNYSLLNIVRHIGFPCFIKPSNMGSSVGITKAHNLKELKFGLNLAKKYDTKIIIEKAVPNVREFECSVLGNENPRTSVVGEITASNEFYDYDAKYIDGKSQAIIPAKIPKKLSKQIRELAIKAYKSLNCEGMARVDFLYDSKKRKIYINELNTIPGFTQISMYPKLWLRSGLKYSELLNDLIRLAIQKYKNKNKLLISYKPSKEWYLE